MNYYTAPQTMPEPVQKLYRDKKMVVGTLQNGRLILPNSCIKCCDLGSQHSKRLTWMPTWALLFFVFGGIGLIIAYFATAKHTQVVYTLCEQHTKQRKVIRMATWGLLILMIGCFVREFFIVGMIAMLILFVLALQNSNFLRITKINNDQAWLKGPGSAFVTQLPEFRS